MKKVANILGLTVLLLGLLVGTAIWFSICVHEFEHPILPDMSGLWNKILMGLGATFFAAVMLGGIVIYIVGVKNIVKYGSPEGAE